MTEAARIVVVGGAPASAERLLGIVPDDLPTTVVLLSRPDDGTADVLDCDEVVVVEDLVASSPSDLVGPFVRPFLADNGVLVVDDGQPGRDLAGWVTASLDAAVVWGVDELRASPEGLTAGRMILGGSHRVDLALEGDGPAVVIAKPSTVKPSTTNPDPANPGPANPGTDQPLDASGCPQVRFVRADPPPPLVRPLRADADDDTADTTAAGPVALATASIVVSVGRGIGGPEHVPLFRDLADRLGAALGATRAVVDAGWLPFAHQVGQTGTVVAPDVYLAFGISGAIQHLAGMRDSRRVIAVNTDPGAAMCRIAELVVTADACRVARDLLARLPAPTSQPGDAARGPDPNRPKAIS